MKPLIAVNALPVMKKKMALTILCGAMLMFFATAAWADGDPCSNPSWGQGVGPVNGHTFCAVVITINPGTSGPVATITPGIDPNAYDGDDDVLVGIQNNSSSPVSSITLIAPAGAKDPGFHFVDNDGPCFYPIAGSPHYSWCSNAGFFGYEGPDNTFINMSEDKTTGTVSFITPIPANGSTWFALDNVPTSATVVTQSGNSMNSDGGGLNQSFSLSDVGGQKVQFLFDFSPAFHTGNLAFPNGPVTPFVSFSGITRAQWKVLVHGTAMADTDCLTAAGLKDPTTGETLCVVNTLTATTDTQSTPSGANLPKDNSAPNTRDILFKQTLDLDPNQVSPIGPGPGANQFQLVIPHNAAPGLAEFNDSGACEFPTGDPLFNQACPRSVMTSIEDGPTKPGGTPHPAGSATVLFCCEPEWTAVPSPSMPPLWSNSTTSIPVSFTSTPPATPSSDTNNFHAAQGLGVSFGAVPRDVPLDPTFSYPTEQTTLNPIACPNSSAWSAQVPAVFTATGTLTQFDDVTAGPGGAPANLKEGAYDLLFAPLDCDEFLGLHYPSQITIAGGNEISGNLATWNRVPFNIDKTLPTVTTPVLNPPGGTYVQGATVTASFTCADPLSSGVHSGIASCGPMSGGGALSVNVTNAPVSTLNTGSFNFTASATDVAGNPANSLPAPYQVVGKADLAIAMLASLQVKKGQNLTYFIGVANIGPSTAQSVTVNDALPAGTTFVSAGYAIESCNFSNGQPICSIVPPTNSCGSIPGTCSIGSLPAWAKKNPMGALVQITVKVPTTFSASTVKNTTTVSGVPGADPVLKNNTANWTTQVTR